MCFVKEHISITAIDANIDLARVGTHWNGLWRRRRVQTEARVSPLLQDYKAISQRADLHTQSINHIPDYSTGGNGVCIVSQRQM